jgi:hypothetical protein
MKGSFESLAGIALLYPGDLQRMLDLKSN